MYRIALFALVLAITPPLAAEEPEGFFLAPMLGYSIFDDDIDNDWHTSLGLGYRFDNPWAVELVYGRSETESERTGMDIEFDRWHIDGLYHLESDGDLQPYLSAGIGRGEYDTVGSSVDETLLNIGAGLKYFFSSNTSLRGEAKLFHGDDIDSFPVGLSVGLHHNFGRAAPPAPPAPLDSDNDGVIDSQDRCPASPAGSRVNAQGCPPDTDGDGVLDSADKCPNTPRGASVNARGCALDSDGDGVADYKDKCPGTTNRAARVDKDGCYLVLAQKVSVELDVEFDTNSADYRPEHLAQALKVSDFMYEYPLTKVVIEGHTDSRGNADYNKDLSQRRAKAIADLLINRFGIDASRVRAVGYGEANPRDTNDTAQGRQRNRRVVGVVEAKAE